MTITDDMVERAKKAALSQSPLTLGRALTDAQLDDVIRAALEAALKGLRATSA